MKLNSKIFRAYDIRGVAFVDFDEDGFFAIASAFGKYISDKFGIEQPKIFVSGDGRNSMPEMYPAIISGLEDSHCSVSWGGAIPTPLNYFALNEGNFDASIQISASHNPPEYNGLKLTDREGAVCGEEIQLIRKLAECTECRVGIDFGECAKKCEEQDFLPQYIGKLKSITDPQDPKKILMDCGNAIPGMFYPEILESFGHTVEPMYCDLNPNFPNHQPDPEESENLKDLVEKIENERSFDFGFAYDGDGDRLGIVLNDGIVLSADKILYCLAFDFLSRNKGETIVLDAMSSSTLAEKIKTLDGKVVWSKTGHSYIEETMHKHHAKLGGEQSGHFMFGENFYGHDDAMLASLRFLQAIENNPELISEITTAWPELLEFSEKIEVADEQKFKVLKKVIDEISRKYPQANTIDGIRVDFPDGEWVIIRCSNTSPKISIRMEMKDKKRLHEMSDYFVGILEKHL